MNMATSLKIGVVGAGVAGLATAIGLSRAGHEIEIFEKSKFSNETGAAIIIGPNGSRILSSWEFDVAAAKGMDYTQILRVKASTLEIESREHFDSIEEKYGSPWLMLHRADLHHGLKSLAESQASKIRIRLGNAVTDLDVESGRIKLADGSELQKDLIIIADGAHSKFISTITSEESSVQRSPMSMYRFLQPFDKVTEHSGLEQFFDKKSPGFTTFYEGQVGRPGLLMNTYPCRNNELLYVALLHPTRPHERNIDSWDAPANVKDVLMDASKFHPAVQKLCVDATEIKVYNMMWRDPLTSYVKGKALLIGDAAHLALPTHGQGANMALEDAKALEVLLNGCDTEKLPDRLRMYDEIRLPRLGAVQTMSNKMNGPPDKMISAIRRWFSGAIPGADAKTYSKEYNDFFFLYNIADEAEKIKVR